jgi:hypothetical protein
LKKNGGLKTAATGYSDGGQDMSAVLNLYTIKSGAVCARIHWARRTFDKVKLLLLADLEHLDDLRRVLDVPDGLLVQLPAVSATAIMQPRDALKIRQWVFLFMKWQSHCYLICSCLR